MGIALHRKSELGLSLLEICAACVMGAVGLMALAGVMISTSRMREQSSAQRAALDATSTVLEQLRATDPDFVLSTFNNRTTTVGIANLPGCKEVSIDTQVDDSERELLEVTLQTDWSSGGDTRAITFVSKVFNASD